MASFNKNRKKWLFVLLGLLIVAVLLIPIIASASDLTVASVNWGGDGKSNLAEIAVNWASKLDYQPLVNWGS